MRGYDITRSDMISKDDEPCHEGNGK
ncbi:hypothetical protein L195_g051264, partial [Trifolium pratense]